MLRTLIDLQKALEKSSYSREEISKLIEQAKSEKDSITLPTEKLEKPDECYTMLGIIIKFAPKDILKDLLDEALSSDNIDLDTKVYRNKDGVEYTALGIAIKEDKINAVEYMFKNYPILRNKIARWDNDFKERTFKPIGIAIKEGKEKILKTLLNLYPELIDETAQNEQSEPAFTPRGRVIEASKDVFTPYGIAVANGNFEAMMILSEFDPNIAKQSARYNSRGSYSSLAVAISYNQHEILNFLSQYPDLINKLAISGRDVAKMSHLWFAISLDKMEATKILLENQADTSKIEHNLGWEFALKYQPEIDKIKKAKKVYEGDISIPAEEINQDYLFKLCRELGTPEHLLISQDAPLSPAYSKIINDLQTKEAKEKYKIEYLNHFISELLINNYPDITSMRTFDDLIKIKQQNYFKDLNQKERDIIEKTIEFYEKKPHLKPQNFLTILTEEEFDEKLQILVKNREIADKFFADTKDWVLPLRQKYGLQKLKKEYDKISQSTKEEVISQSSKRPHPEIYGLESTEKKDPKKSRILSADKLSSTTKNQIDKS